MTKIFIIAGEASGDQLGASLLNAWSRQDPNCVVRGIGGQRMTEAGMGESFFPMDELSVMGIFEILPKIPHFARRIRQTVLAIKVFDPDVVITIDSPDFSFRVQEQLKKSGVRAKRVHYVAPTVWAWRPGRAQRIAQFLDGIICLLPFEPPYFEKEGLRSVSVGHPVMDSGLLDGHGEKFRFANGIGASQKVLGLFFGSRRGEIERLSPIILEVAKRLQAENPDLIFIVPTLDRWSKYLSRLLTDAGLSSTFVVSNKDEKWDAVRACTAAIAVSGTVALEIALAGVPHAILYKMNTVTWAFVKRVVRTKFAHLGNILLGHLVVPEFIQDDATADKVTPVIRALLNNTVEQRIQSEAFAQIRQMLKPDEKNAADEAAAFIRNILN